MINNIVTITINASLDKFTTIGQVVPNDKLRCSAAVYQAEGGGINVSRAIRRLGGSSKAVFTCGRANGRLLEEIIAEKGIDYKAISVKDATREFFQFSRIMLTRHFDLSCQDPNCKKVNGKLWWISSHI